MIVLDEQLADAQIIQGFAQWYKGTVATIKHLRPGSRILDDVIPALLLTIRSPTFVTINYTDFWKVVPAHSSYCVVCLKLTQAQASEAALIVRDLLSLPEFRTKRARMGIVISVTTQGIETYRTA